MNTLASSVIAVERGCASKTIKGVLLAFLADNLARNELNGLKKSFSFAFCWFVMYIVTTNSICSSFMPFV